MHSNTTIILSLIVLAMMTLLLDSTSAEVTVASVISGAFGHITGRKL